MTRFAISCVLGVAVLFVGCGQDDEKPNYHPIEGRIVSIDRQSGVVEIEFLNKRNELDRRAGRLAPDAEILINGVVARPEDVFADEKVKVMCRIEERNGMPEFVATSVEVIRDEAPTSEPEDASNGETPEDG